MTREVAGRVYLARYKQPLAIGGGAPVTFQHQTETPQGERERACFGPMLSRARASGQGSPTARSRRSKAGRCLACVICPGGQRTSRSGSLAARALDPVVRTKHERWSCFGNPRGSFARRTVLLLLFWKQEEKIGLCDAVDDTLGRSSAPRQRVKLSSMSSLRKHMQEARRQRGTCMHASAVCTCAR